MIAKCDHQEWCRRLQPLRLELWNSASWTAAERAPPDKTDKCGAVLLQAWLYSIYYCRITHGFRSSVFLNLEQRTRFTMLNDVSSSLIDETNKYLNGRKSTNSSTEENSLGGKEKGLLTNMKNFLGKKSESKSFLNSTQQSSVGKSGYATLGPPQPPLLPHPSL